MAIDCARVCVVGVAPQTAQRDSVVCLTRKPCHVLTRALGQYHCLCAGGGPLPTSRAADGMSMRVRGSRTTSDSSAVRMANATDVAAGESGSPSDARPTPRIMDMTLSLRPTASSAWLRSKPKFPVCDAQSASAPTQFPTMHVGTATSTKYWFFFYSANNGPCRQMRVIESPHSCKRQVGAPDSADPQRLVHHECNNPVFLTKVLDGSKHRHSRRLSAH